MCHKTKNTTLSGTENLKFCVSLKIYLILLRCVNTQRDPDRERERGFLSWNSLVICRRTVQIECERKREPFLRSVYTERDRDRERDRGFSSWNSLVICRRTVQIECEREREQFFVRANDRLDCPQSEFFRRSRGFFAIFQSASIFLASFPQIEMPVSWHFL